MAAARYNLIGWNGSYGTKAKFIALDTKTKLQTVFTPGRAKDLAWVDKDLKSQGEYKDWDDFGHEPVDNLEDIVF